MRSLAEKHVARIADRVDKRIEVALISQRPSDLATPGDNLIVLSDMLGGRDKVDSVQLRTAE